MLTRALGLLRHLVWHQSATLIKGAAFFCALGLVASAGVSVWLRRRSRESLGGTDMVEGTSLSSPLLFLFCLADWALLQALPLLKLSFAVVTLLPLLASVIVRLAIFWTIAGAALLARWRRKKQHLRLAAGLFLALNLAFSAIQLDAYVLEPLLVETTRLSLAFDDLDPGAPPVRIVHLTDTHIERNSFREQTVIRQVNALQPDIIVFTGDYLNTSYMEDPETARQFKEFAGQLHAPYGIYAVRGTVEWRPAYMQALMEGTNVTWLEQKTVMLDVRGQRVTLIGVACSHEEAVDAARLDQAMAGVPESAFTVLLYHSPELIAEAAAHKIDLYLAGHTHGGQLRLPFYGAIVTLSRYGKQYEAGLYEKDDTQMYISRGIGFEGGGMPRARFLCRPEIVNVELQGK